MDRPHAAAASEDPIPVRLAANHFGVPGTATSRYGSLFPLLATLIDFFPENFHGAGEIETHADLVAADFVDVDRSDLISGFVPQNDIFRLFP
jgi:hypothetical protein